MYVLELEVLPLTGDTEETEYLFKEDREAALKLYYRVRHFWEIEKAIRTPRDNKILKQIIGAKLHLVDTDDRAVAKAMISTGNSEVIRDAANVLAGLDQAELDELDKIVSEALKATSK